MPHPVPGLNSPLLELAIELRRDEKRPLAVQLADALRGAAIAGQLRGGDRLPSTRALARHLAVSRTVTAAAYEQLHAEGWIVGRHGSGTFVTTAPPGAVASAPVAVPPEPEQDMINLTPGAPWADGLDRAAWRRAWRSAADAAPATQPMRAGLPEYRAAVVDHLLRHRGLVVDAPGIDTVLATAGTSAAVAELAAACFEPGAVVAFEEPGYQRAVGAFEAAGMRVVGVPVDHVGLKVADIPSGVRAVYCSPAHQYPIGGRLTAERRVALVERARAENWLIVEDDYDGELRYDVAPLPVLASLAPDVVVHLGTTSKILSPTLGVGWMLAPDGVASAVVAHREWTGTGPAPAGQRVVVEFAQQGDLARHLRRLRRELSQRRALIVDELSGGPLAVFGDQAGAHVVLPLPDGAAEARLIEAAATRGLMLDGLRRHHRGPPQWYGIPLGYAQCSREELARAVEVLGELSQDS